MVAVSYTYADAPTPALEQVSWSLAAGRSLALVGESGAGKTTLLDLVTGLLGPTTGMVTVDGVPLTEVDVDAWQRRIGLVQQHSPLFHVSVAENVSGSRVEVDRDRVCESLELANARSFVDVLPAGIDTVIGEAGAKLSGGQRQRLALARALYRRPWLLVLDEPTSALDAESEQLLVAALSSLRGECAVIIAAHRLATIRGADEVLVLDHGRVVERGSYAALAADPSGLLARMLGGDGPGTAP
jgi:ABC-type multidrug transport system fused ATPase/permease subunit